MTHHDTRHSPQGNRRLAAAALAVSLAAAPIRSAAAPRRHPARRAPRSHPPARAAIKVKLSAVKAQIQQHQSKLTGVKVDIRNAQEQLRVQKARVARLADQVRELQTRVEEAGRRLGTARRRLAAAEQRVQEATVRLQKAERRMTAHRQRLSVRIARSYTAGTVTFADVLLRSCSLSDFLDRQYYVDRVFQSDMEFLTELREERRIVALQRAELERKRAEQADAKEEMHLELQEVQGLKESRQQLLHRVETEKDLKEEELKELEQDSESIRDLLSREWQRRQDLWRQLHHGLNVPLPAWVGKWLRPVANCPISSGFGMRFHPILGYARLHSGIDFAAPLGTPIRCAADGEVLWASWRGGYGRCIIVLHGGGVATLYGHCSEVLVHPGQPVKRGQLIGATGSTGLSTGPHLHFEIRVNGQPVNPIGH